MRCSPIAALLLLAAAPVFAEDAASAARQAEFARLPYWGGLWLTENDESTIGGLNVVQEEARATGQAANRKPVMSLFGFAAPWNDEGKRRMAARPGNGNRTAEGWGYPMMMNGAAPLQFLITPEEVLIINAYRDVRHIRTDRKDHPAADDLWPTVWGDSVGHWEGDTLVIDTVAVTDPAVFFHGGPPFSEDAHYVERLHMVSPTKIEGEITITDPATLTQPWTVQLAWTRDDSFGRMVHDVFTNDRTDSVNGTIAPPKDEQ
ncbi:MAG: hypothetical protein P0Y56_04755 [Candidatus Andeanibacterium colombiense]|uniref:Uncharacterized protein n=1 Tax=Candidatus Andeanibacterium colombiense TaxID=3121345 RepID=A0AAJ5X868_9SPHN|nr:MAG: hypothetical protein P0Y56_04755 [Sphingomonadaceae bacterium]